MTAAVAFEFEELVKLARDKSQESRSILVATINDLYSSEEKLLT